MSTYVVMTALGPDRPGLVDSISQFLSGKNVNIEDSRMAVLGGEFAIILLASGDEKLNEVLNREIDSLRSSTGLDIHIKPTISPNERKIEPSRPHRITLTGLDHPGLVREVTGMLKKYDINIESLDTHVTNAPISGSPIFNMRCVVSIPARVRLSEIRGNIAELESRLNIDIEFQPMEKA